MSSSLSNMLDNLDWDNLPGGVDGEGSDMNDADYVPGYDEEDAEEEDEEMLNDEDDADEQEVDGNEQEEQTRQQQEESDDGDDSDNDLEQHLLFVDQDGNRIVPTSISGSFLLALLRGRELGTPSQARRLVEPRGDRFQPASEPVEAGENMLASGEFGRVLARNKTRNMKKTVQRAKRGLGLPVKEDIYRNMVPNGRGTVVATYDDNVYAGQFSADSSFFYTCVQDFRLHIYDTNAPITYPPPPTVRHYGGRRGTGSHQTTMKVTKTIEGMSDGWTITDSHLSPDSQNLVYAVMSSTLYMARVSDDSQEQVALQFATASEARSNQYMDWYDRPRIWSCRFSADGKEIVAGGSGKLMVYDLGAGKRSVSIDAHENDVNSCCWADASSGNVLVSASDDTFLKVWDRRSLAASAKPSGVLIGHTEGITYVSPKGDGRYVISNGKDQALRLWDLRMMAPAKKLDEPAVRKNYGVKHYDYRQGIYHKGRYDAHPEDCSVMTYHGHTVLRTLIRCHFSPAETTGQQYIYSGSADGIIHIWSLDGTIVERIDRRRVLDMAIPPSDFEEPAKSYRPPPFVGQHVVRDVSWHSKQPVLMSCAWKGQNQRSDVARHEWKGLSKLNNQLEDWVEKRRSEAHEGQSLREDDDADPW